MVWQATALAVVGVALGIPAGVAVGHFVWEAVADGLGVSTASRLAPVAFLAVAAATLLLANVFATAPARAAVRTRPAVVLRSE